MRICGYAQDRGACTQLRIAGPLKKIGGLRLADVSLIELGDQDIQAKVASADVVLMGRAASDPVSEMIRQMHSLGKKVVYDLDDNMFGVSPFSPHYQNFGIMPVNMDHPELGVAPMWVNGQGNFDDRRNRKMRESFIRIIRSVDCVTVTTPTLQKIYKRYNDNVVVIPNAIDLGVWKRPAITHASGKVRVIYTGAANHYEDWQYIKGVLSDLMEKNKEWTLIFVGQNWHDMPGHTLDLKRIEYHDWCDIESYPYLMRSLCCDIGIAPISKVAFNDCRSSIKWLEYSAIGAATIATDYGPYRRDCENGKDALLVDSQEDWAQGLLRLIEDKELRNKLATNALKKAKRQYDLDYMADRWVEVFQGVLNK